jgi:hypothetical protein
VNRGLIWTGVVVALVGGTWFGLSRMFSAGETNSAKERVRRVFDGTKPGGDSQRAIFLWWNGSLNMPPGGQEEFTRAADAFEVWRAKREIKQVSSYTIKDATVVEPAKGLRQAVVEVSGTVDGKDFKMRVVQGEPIAWVPEPGEEGN